MATNPIGAGTGGYVLYIIKESTWGVAPTARANYFMLPAEPLSGLDNVMAVVDDLRRGQNIIGFNRMEGVHKTELPISTIAYPDQTGWFLVSIMGDDVLTGTGPYTHTFDVLSDIPTSATPSLTVAVVNDVLTGGNALVHTGVKVTGATFRFTTAEGFLTLETSTVGKGAQTATAAGLTGSFPTSEPSSNDPLRGWEGFVTNGGGQLNGKITECEIAVAREADVIFAAGSSADPNNKFADAVIHGMVGITGRLVAMFDNMNAVDLYRNFSTDNLLIQFDNNVSGAGKRSLKFDVKKATYGESPAEIDVSGNHMTIAFNFRGLYDGSSGKGLQVVLVNNKSVAYDV